MAKQEIWIRVQDDLQEAHSLFCNLIDSGGKVCVNIDSYGRLFQKLKDIRERKTIQAEFYDLPDDEKKDRALKMMSVLKGLNLYTGKGSGETAGGDVDVSYLLIADEWDKELQEWERVYSGLISDVAMFVVMYCNTGGNEPQQYTESLLDLFKGRVDLIERLRYEDRGTVVRKVREWGKKGQIKNVGDRLASKFAKELINNRVVEPKEENKDDIDSFRKMF